MKNSTTELHFSGDVSGGSKSNDNSYLSTSNDHSYLGKIVGSVMSMELALAITAPLVLKCAKDLSRAVQLVIIVAPVLLALFFGMGFGHLYDKTQNQNGLPYKATGDVSNKISGESNTDLGGENKPSTNTQDSKAASTACFHRENK